MVKLQLGRRVHLSRRIMPARIESGALLHRGEKKWNGIKALLLTSSIRSENSYCLIEWEVQTQLLHCLPSIRKSLPSTQCRSASPRQTLAYILAGAGSIRHWQQHLPLAFATMSNYRAHQELLMYPRKSCSARNVVHTDTFTFQRLQVLSNWREAGFRTSMNCQSLPEGLRNTLSCEHNSSIRHESALADILPKPLGDINSHQVSCRLP